MKLTAAPSRRVVVAAVQQSPPYLGSPAKRLWSAASGSYKSRSAGSYDAPGPHADHNAADHSAAGNGTVTTPTTITVTTLRTPC